MTTDRLDAGHVYRPPPYQPRAGECCHAVHNDFGVGFHQCRRKSKVSRDVLWDGKPVTLEYCGTHDPVTVKAKRDARRAADDARRQAQREKWNKEKRDRDLAKAAVDALREIAAGHNDARSLAQAVLDQFQ